MNLKQIPGQTFQRAKAIAPWTQAHKQASINAEAERQAAVDAKKQSLQATGAPGAAIALQKESPMEGTINEFKRLLADAIMYGYQRDDSKSTTDVDIRNAVRQQGFIDTVANATADSRFATPIEAEDGRYAKDMRKIREELAGKLASGNVGSLCNNELDIILSIILASPSAEKNPPACDAYDNTRAYTAFFDFLENAAQNGAPGNEGTFIANVLLTLVSRNTMDEQVTVATMRNMANVALIDRTLGQIADPMLENAVALFKQALDGALALPTTELHPQLEVPGLGYDYVPGITAAMTERTEAMAAVETTKTANDSAVAAYSQIAAKQPPADATTLAAADKLVQDTGAALQAAITRMDKANNELLRLEPGLGGMCTQQATQLIGQLINQEKEPLQISNKFGDTFRLAFIGCRRNGKGMEEVLSDKPDDKTGLDKLGDTGHPLVMAATTEAREVAKFTGENGPLKALNKILMLEAGIKGAQMPDDVRSEMLAVTAKMKEPQCTAIDKEIEKVEKRFGYPAKSAARCAMRNYAEIHTGKIPDEQWITARLRFQGDASLKSLNLRRDKFRKFKNDIQRITHFQLPDSWYLRYPIQAAGVAVLYYPGKWFIKATFRNPNFNVGIKDQHTTFTDDKGQKQKSRWKRKHTGIVQATSAVVLAAELVGSLVSSINFSLQHNRSVWDGIASWYFRMPPAQVSTAPGRVMRNPLSWWTAQPGIQDSLKTINDDMNIPDRLASRPDSIYRSAFGVGNDSSDAAKKRLNWLRNHPGVLQFFQERTSGVHVNRAWNLPKNASTLRFDTVSVTEGQPKRVVGSDTIPATERQIKTERVWKTLRMDTVRIMDGLVLNRANADAFVDTLRTMEDRDPARHGLFGTIEATLGMKKLDYAFMQANKAAWEDNGFLLPKERLTLMEQLRIKDNGNSLFVMLQPGARGMLEPRAQLGISTEYIEKPDTFVTLWRQNVTKLSGEDPTQVAVSPQALQQAFDSAHASLWGSAIRNATPEFEEAQIMRQVGALHLSDATTDMLRENKDVRGLLLQFGGSSGYNLNPNRIEDFVQRLASYKKGGGKVEDFSPFTHGPRVGWAMGQGYFDTKQFTNQQTQDAAEAAGAQMQPQQGALSAGAQAFYAGTGAAALNPILAEMHANEGAKQRVYDFLTNTSTRGEAAKRLASLTVSGQGAGMTVAIGDNAKAKKWLATCVRR